MAPLRAAIMSGRHSRPDMDAAELHSFLRSDRGALRRWFGAEKALWLRADPARLRGAVDRDIASLDELVAAQLDVLLHHPVLQRLEGSWRGLAWLVKGFEPGRSLKFAVLPATWREIDRDLSRVSEFDQSNLFRLIYEDEFGRAGGEPFGLLVVDHEVRHRPRRRVGAEPAPIDDIAVMTALAAIATAAFVPVVLGASPALLGVDRFEDLVLSQEVAALLGDEEHARWRALAGREEARFLCVTMPRVLARPRWTEHAGHEEYAPTAAQRSWSVAGYAFAATVGRAHEQHRWPGGLRGVPSDGFGGSLVLQLPREDFSLGAATRWARPSTDCALTDRQERDASLAGLMPLNMMPYGDAAFGSVHSLQARVPATPGRTPTAAFANRRVSAEISAMLCVSRFAHYIKIIGRDLTGSFATANDIERRLQAWLMRYVNASPDSASRASQPLRSGRVQVNELEGRPGSFGCVIHLQPHYQLDDVSAIFRLVTGFVATGAT